MAAEDTSTVSHFGTEDSWLNEPFSRAAADW
jgi:hypothetical protein